MSFQSQSQPVQESCKAQIPGTIAILRLFLLLVLKGWDPLVVYVGKWNLWMMLSTVPELHRVVFIRSNLSKHEGCLEESVLHIGYIGQLV